MDRAEVLRLGNVDNTTLLDVGAGPLAVIAARDFNCRVTTIDTSVSALESARREAVTAGVEGRISFHQEDVTELSYADNSFDVAVSYGALHHIPAHKRESFLRELLRVTRAKIIIADYTSSEFQRIHPGGEYQAVDLQWLEGSLRRMGQTQRHLGDKMGVYVCRLQSGNDIAEGE